MNATNHIIMALEIERKYLVKKYIDFAKIAESKHEICQGYLSCNADVTVRVRIRDNEAFVTVKSRNRGYMRNEWEYRIPLEDGREMLQLPGVLSLSKTRYKVKYDGHIWEIDVFHGKLEGLVLAEIELSSPEEVFDIPDFVGKEVSDDVRYFNSNLVKAVCVPD